MDAKNIVKELITLRGWSQAKLAEECGMKRQSNVTGVLNRGTSLRVDTLEAFCEALGCEIIIRDKMGSKKEWRVKSE